MTLDLDISNLDNEILSKANHVLSLLNSPLEIRNASEVTPVFIVRLFAQIFGDSILPHPISTSGTLHNLDAVVQKLSTEIGTELDHIDPEEILSGDKRTIYDLLELLAAFMLCSLEEKLLKVRLLSCGHSERELMSHSSTSPELPRSVGRPCLLSKRLQGSPTLVPKLSSDVRPAVLSSATPNKQLRDSRSVQIDQSFRPDSDMNLLQNISPSEVYHQLRQPRYMSIMSIQTAISPPATPKTADDFVEILGQHSPLINAPSLPASPTNYPTKSGIPVQGHDVENGECAVNKQPEENSSFCIDKQDSVPNVHLITDHLSALSSRHRKVSSSSSGRGPSPTHTLTVHEISASSSAPSLSGSYQPADHKSNLVDGPAIHRAKKSQTRSMADTHSVPADKSSHEQCNSSAGSISHWAENSGGGGRADDVKSALDSLTTMLSSSLHSSLDVTHMTNARKYPSAATLIAKSEGFTKALKQRLDYLRTVFSRAHEEAEAVGRLVRAIESRRSKTVELMLDRATNTNKRDLGLSTPSRSLERSLKAILCGMNLLLTEKRNPPPRRRSHRTRHSYPQDQSKLHHRSPFEPKRCGSSATALVDVEYRELLNLKHKLMIEALQACYLALDSHKTKPLRSH